MKSRDITCTKCDFCHKELGLYTVKVDKHEVEEFCSDTCAESWKHYEDRHPFFEPEILDN